MRTKTRQRDSHIFEREKNDWYLEPHWCSARLFDVEPFDRGHALLDPCVGTGRVANAAKAAVYKVITCDIVDRGYPGCKIQDFLKRRSAPPSVVGNPPFDSVEAFARHAMVGADKVALIFPVARLNAAHWIRELPLCRIWLMTPRPSMPPGPYVLAGRKVGGGKPDFCWIVFERGHASEPVIRWLHRDGE
jgi:hypothetical protein